MQKLTVIASFVVAALLVTSCGDTDSRMNATGPTTLTTESASLNLTSSIATLNPAQTTFSFCPVVAPVTVALNLSVTAGLVSVSVVELGFQFVATSGTSAAPQVTLPAPVPTTQFGSALVQARQTRVFPLTVGLGCGTGQRGTITVIVVTRDQSGRMTTGQVSALVR
jgi:hypothetical protein